MQFNEYQKLAAQFELMEIEGEMLAHNPAYVAKVLGLIGEAGEVAEKYKKLIRDKQGLISAEDAAEIKKELGDVLWYVAMIAQYLDTPLEDVARLNIQKLSDRKVRGVQHGKGDNR